MYLLPAFVFALIVIWLLVSPHFKSAADYAVRTTDESSLTQHKNRCLQILRDLELDYSTEKISQEDYEKTKRVLEHELGALLIKLKSTP